jgi:hypothetical protein
VLSLIASAGCHEYLVPEQSFEKTISMSKQERKRAALLAVRTSDKEPVWVRSSRVVIDDSPPHDGWVLARGKSPSPLVITGVLTLAAGAVFLGLGTNYLSRIPDDDAKASAQDAQCRRLANPQILCGFNLDPAFDRLGGGVFLGVGVVLALGAAVQIALGSKRSMAEVTPNQPGVLYLR